MEVVALLADRIESGSLGTDVDLSFSLLVDAVVDPAEVSLWLDSLGLAMSDAAALAGAACCCSLPGSFS